MKFILLVILFFVLQLSHAQKTDIDFGKPRPEDISLKEYAKDKSAAAVVLYDYTKVSFEYEYSQSKYIIEKQVRIKILHNSGVESGNVSIPFISTYNFEDLQKVKGVTINPGDGSKPEITEINNSNVYKTKEKKSSSTLKIAFPNIRAGSIIDYKYKITREALFSIPIVYLQQDIPVVKAVVEFDLPEFLQVKQEFVGVTKEKNTETVTDKYLTFKDGGREQFKGYNNKYEFSDLQPVKNEELMYGSMRNYWKRIESSVVAILIPGAQPEYYNDTWGMVGGSMRANKFFWGQITKEVKIKELNDAVSKIKDDTEKATYICNYVKNKFSWNQEYTLTSRDIAKVAELKTGSNGDLNLLLVSLLRHAGLEAYPVLCSTNDYGIINRSNPDIDEFNYPMAMVQVKDKLMIVDAAEKYESCTILPQKIMTNSVYIISDKKGRFLDVWDADNKQKQNTAMNIVLTDKAILEGTAYLKSYEYERAERLKKFKTNKPAFEKEYLTGDANGVGFTAMETTNEDVEADVFEQKLSFAHPATQTGEYVYFNPNMLLHFGKNPFMVANRNFAINFQTNIQKKLFVKITLPENMVSEGLPESKKFINSDTSIIVERKVTGTENEIFYTLNFEIKKPIYTIEEYLQVKEVYKNLYALLEEQIVLKKKK